MRVNTSPLTGPELERLFSVCESEDLPKACLLHLLLESGMRLEEAVTLEPRGILGGGGCVVARWIRDSDGRPARFHAVTPALHAKLSGLARAGSLFQIAGESSRETVRRWRAELRKVFLEAGLDGSSVYRLRRTYLASFAGDPTPGATSRRLG
jgi:integrase